MIRRLMCYLGWHPDSVYLMKTLSVDPEGNGMWVKYPVWKCKHCPNETPF